MLETEKKAEQLTCDESFISVCEFFWTQVKKHPDAIAVISGGKQLTYKNLADQAIRLANYLRGQGVRAETIVGLSLQNDLNLIIGILGIFLSGGAYLPIDPNYPVERIEIILNDAKPYIFLTDRCLHGKFSFYSQKVVLIDE